MAAPIVKNTGGTSRVIFEGVSKLANDISRCRKCSLAVERSSYINFSDLEKNKYLITYQAYASNHSDSSVFETFGCDG